MYRNQLRNRMNFDHIEEMFKDKLFCDVTLVAEDGEIAVHKLLLALCSPYFHREFCNDRKLSLSNPIEVEDITYETLSEVIMYLYTSQVLIMDKNVEDILAAAHKFGLRDLQDACCEFLRVNICIKNCVRISDLASRYNCQELVKVADEYIRAYISKLMQDEDYLDMNYDQIQDIVARGGLPEDVLDCVIQWVRHDLQHRKDYFHSLNKHVNFALISPSEVQCRIDKEEWLQSDSQFLDRFKFYALNETLSSPTLTDQSSNLLAVVGITGDHFLSVELYDFQMQIWLKGPEATNIPCDADTIIALHDMRIYCIRRKKIKYIDISCDPTQMIWLDYDFLLEVEYYDVAKVLDALYFVNGHGPNAQKFVFSTGELKKISNTTVGRGAAGLGALNGHLYVVGGDLTCNYDNPLDLVECYNTKNDSWHTMPPMSTRRCGPGVGALGNSLFVVGGWDASEKQVECFDPVKRTWSRLPDMNVARGGPGLIVVNDQLYVIGGYKNGCALDSVEIYDRNSNAWSMLPCSMNRGKHSVVAALIDKTKIKF